MKINHIKNNKLKIDNDLKILPSRETLKMFGGEITRKEFI